MIFLGEFKAGDTVFYAANFHNDTDTIEDPTSPEAQIRNSAGTWSALTAPAKQNTKTGHYGGTIDTTGYSVGQHVIRMAGTVATAKTIATEFCFTVVANIESDTYAKVDTEIADIQARLPAALTANGNMKSSIMEILSTALTETAGQIAAAFKQFFDVASPTGTMKAITNVVTTTFTGDVTGSVGSLATQAKADVNAEVDSALNTAIPGSPTSDSINERVKAIDDFTGASYTTFTVQTSGGNGQLQFKTDLSSTVDDSWRGGWVQFTSGILAGLPPRRISSYNGTTKVIVLTSTFPSTPADGVTGIIIVR